MDLAAITNHRPAATDAGTPPIEEDAGGDGTDAGRVVPGAADPGCACRSTGGGDAGALFLLAAALLWRRRL